MQVQGFSNTDRTASHSGTESEIRAFLGHAGPSPQTADLGRLGPITNEERLHEPFNCSAADFPLSGGSQRFQVLERVLSWVSYGRI